MFKVIDCVILVVLVSLAILIGFISKFEKWRVKWHERCEKKKKLARRIELDPDGEFALDVTETTLMGAANGQANSNLADLSPSSTATQGAKNPEANGPSFIMNAISLVIGFQTSTSIVGLPLEFYYYGARSYQFALCMFIAPILIALFFVPFLYKIKSASIYDYLDGKFGQGSKQVSQHLIYLIV